jgi:hypothetical protein
MTARVFFPLASFFIFAAAGLAAPAAQAQTTFSLLPPSPCPPPAVTPHNTPRCGAARQTINMSWQKPAGALFEEQYLEVDISASAMLQSSVEHVAVSAFAGAPPFNASGQWTADASGGGVGIALGQLGNCPGGALSTHVQLGIERFDWGSPMDSNIVACAQIPKTTLASVPTVRLGLFVMCTAGFCDASAWLDNPVSLASLATVSANGILLENPLPRRRIFYAVSNFADEAFNYPATFSVRTENYWTY